MDQVVGLLSRHVDVGVGKRAGGAFPPVRARALTPLHVVIVKFLVLPVLEREVLQQVIAAAGSVSRGGRRP